nr:DUF6522 family protein [Bradyrhizobium diazoefficiens]
MRAKPSCASSTARRWRSAPIPHGQDAVPRRHDPVRQAGGAIVTSIELENGTFQIDATIVAEGLQVSPHSLREGMRAGRITGFVERGTGADAGRHRLSFLSQDRRFRVVIDDRTGEIIQRSSIAFEGSSLPGSARRPGG